MCKPVHIVKIHVCCHVVYAFLKVLFDVCLVCTRFFFVCFFLSFSWFFVWYMYEKASICLLRRVFRNISSSSPSFFGKNRKPKSVILITYLILFCYFFSLSFQMLDILVWMEVAFFFRCVYVEFDLSLPSYAKSDVRRRVTQEFAVDFFFSLARYVWLMFAFLVVCLFIHSFAAIFLIAVSTLLMLIYTHREKGKEKKRALCVVLLYYFVSVSRERVSVYVCVWNGFSSFSPAFETYRKSWNKLYFSIYVLLLDMVRRDTQIRCVTLPHQTFPVLHFQNYNLFCVLSRQIAHTNTHAAERRRRRRRRCCTLGLAIAIGKCYYILVCSMRKSFSRILCFFLRCLCIYNVLCMARLLLLLSGEV